MKKRCRINRHLSKSIGCIIHHFQLRLIQMLVFAEGKSKKSFEYIKRHLNDQIHVEKQCRYNHLNVV